MFSPQRSRLPRPSLRADPVSDLLMAPPSCVIITKIRGICGTFSLSFAGSRIHKFCQLCNLRARLMQARVVPNELVPPGFPRGQDVRPHVFHACALGQLFARAHLRRTEWWRDLDWSADAASAGIRMAAKLIAAANQVG